MSKKQHKPKYYETKEFNKLKQEWDNKLKQQGFNNIVDWQIFDSDVSKKVYQSISKIRANLCNIEIEQCGGKPKEHHKFILEQYSEGKSLRQIAKLLKTQYPDDKSKQMLFKNISKLINRYLKKLS